MPVDISVEEQRAMSADRAGVSKQISGVRHTHTVQGKTVVFGEYDPGKAAGRAQDREFETVLISMKNRHAKTGIQPATVINMLPLILQVNSPMHVLGGVKVAACQGRDLDFTAHTWTECAIEVRYIGDNINQPWDFLPIQLAEAFEAEYFHFGGVVAINGFPTEENLARPENVEKISAALQRMYTWMMAMIVEANGLWNSPNHGLSAAIVDKHRLCASRMFEIGKIPQLPPWMQEVREQSEIDAKCPFCSNIPEAGAVQCTSCNEILDPAEAFRLGKITEEHASLERLTRAEVEELGVSAYVAETSDERPARLKRGDLKPASIAYVRALQAEEEQRERQEEAARKKEEQRAKKAETEAKKSAESTK